MLTRLTKTGPKACLPCATSVHYRLHEFTAAAQPAVQTKVMGSQSALCCQHAYGLPAEDVKVWPEMAGGVVKGVVRAQQAGHLGWGIHQHLPRLAVPGVQSFLLPSAHPALTYKHVILTFGLRQQDSMNDDFCFTAALLHVAVSESKRLSGDVVCN